MGDLGMFGFWMFIAAAVLGGIWSDVKSKESKQETLRRLVESGQEINAQTLDALLNGADSRDNEREYRIGSYVLGGVALGLFVFSLFLGIVSSDARWVLMGVSFLVACIAGGLRVASHYVARDQQSF
ncbi:MAG: hypothetical protein AAGI88_06145 [Pseudomonadota bacterium]